MGTCVRALLATVALAGVTACGGSDDGGPLATVDAGPVHVHGLGYVASSSTLFVATHSGLFALHPDASKATRIGNSRQDTMGFTVLPDGRFLGSGHPDPRDDRPPHLGLVESRDGGRTWAEVSLAGEADFHVLRAAARVVYGFDSSHGRFLVSSDEGRTWVERDAPEPVVDLAIDPSDPEHVLAAGETGLYRSTTGGRRWARAADVSGHLSWPVEGRLYLATPAGSLLGTASPNGPFREVGRLTGAVAALHAAAPDELFAALHDGTILHSTDGGRSWATRSTP